MRAKRKPTVVKYNRLKRIKTNRYRKKKALRFKKMSTSKRYYESHKLRGRVIRSVKTFLDVFWDYKNKTKEELAKEAESLLKEING